LSIWSAFCEGLSVLRSIFALKCDTTFIFMTLRAFWNKTIYIRHRKRKRITRPRSTIDNRRYGGPAIWFDSHGIRPTNWRMSGNRRQSRIENTALNTAVHQNVRRMSEVTNDTMIWDMFLESEHERRISEGERDRYGWINKCATKIYNLPRWKLRESGMWAESFSTNPNIKL
jgi:hypothetical protein